MFFKKNLHLKKLQRKRVAEGRNLTKGLRLDRNEKVDVWPQNFLRDALRGKPSSFFSTYPEISTLYKKIAKFNKVLENQLLITSGIDGSIKNLLSLITKPKDTIAVLSPTYAMYQVYSDIFQLKLFKIGYSNDYEIKKRDLENFFKKKPKILFLPNPNQPIENTFGLETSLEHNTKKSDFRFTLYNNYSPNYHISIALGNEYVPGADYIEWGSGSAGWLYKYQMKGLEARIYGFESELYYDLSKIIKLYSSYSMTRGNNLSDNIPLAYMPPDKLLFSAELDLYPISIDIIFKKAFDQDRLGEFESETDGYLITDLSSSYAINALKLKHKLILTIDNIFNKEHYNHLSRIKSIMPEKGRSIGFQYRVVF